jgi:hypothetical protein
MREGREKLFAAATARGRDPTALTLVAFGLPGALRDPSELAELRKLGVHHTTIWLQERGEAVFAELEALARTTLA